MMTVATMPENPGFEPGGDSSAPENIPFENHPAGILAGSENAFMPQTPVAVATVATAPENPSPGRSYTKRVEIGGKCVMVTLHADRIELRAKYGRQRAEWSFEKLWDAAEGKLL